MTIDPTNAAQCHHTGPAAAIVLRTAAVLPEDEGSCCAAALPEDEGSFCNAALPEDEGSRTDTSTCSALGEDIRL